MEDRNGDEVKKYLAEEEKEKLKLREKIEKKNQEKEI